MKSITKIIIALVGIAAIGLLTYYIVTKEKKAIVKEKSITNPEQDTVATVQVIQETMLERITKALGIDGEGFTLTEEDGVYTNSTKDKMLILKEDAWKKMIKKIQKRFPYTVEDCDYNYQMPDLSEYEFVGLLTYLGPRKSAKRISAYSAIEIRKGNSKSYAAGDICCNCDGEPLVSQQVDAVIIK